MMDRNLSFYSLFQLLMLTLASSLLVSTATSLKAEETEVYNILAPSTSQHLVSSPHFVVRWNDKDNVKLSDTELHQGLDNLEAIWKFYIETIHFPKPYAKSTRKYKVNVNVSNQGWATGSGTGEADPAMWLHYNAFKDNHALAHEFAHCLQFASRGLRDSPYTGWFWECHAEWMAHQMYPNQVGCSEQLLNASHLYYGSTRDRYGNWQLLEYIKDHYGYEAINDIWTKAKKPGEPHYTEETPLSILSRNMSWSTAQLNDVIGDWAMHNVTWDYKNGEVYRKLYGSYDNRSYLRRNRVAILDPLPQVSNGYSIPDYRAPQRYGYNLVRININRENPAHMLSVKFRGQIQETAGVHAFKHEFKNEPLTIPQPNSDWRWGLVLVDVQGKPTYSRLEKGSAGEISMPLSNEVKEAWLVVTATPTEYQKIEWDQPYYTLYRYPWMVEIDGGIPIGNEPLALKGSPDHSFKHPNGGGYVDETAHVDASAYIGPEARVMNKAKVLSNARIEGRAIISGNAQVSEHAIVKDRATVTNSAKVAGNAVVSDEASLYGGLIDEDCKIGSLTIINGAHSHIHGHAIIRSVMNDIVDKDIEGTVQLLGDIELLTSLSSGVFYGIIDKELSKASSGAFHKEPAQEVTKVVEPVWQN